MEKYVKHAYKIIKTKIKIKFKTNDKQNKWFGSNPNVRDRNALNSLEKIFLLTTIIYKIYIWFFIYTCIS